MLLTSIETRGAGDFSPAHDSCPLEVFCALLYNNVKQQDSLASTVIRLRMEASDFSPVYSIFRSSPWDLQKIPWLWFCICGHCSSYDLGLQFQSRNGFATFRLKKAINGPIKKAVMIVPMFTSPKTLTSPILHSTTPRHTQIRSQMIRQYWNGMRFCFSDHIKDTASYVETPRSAVK